jgi:hypothetical protein
VLPLFPLSRERILRYTVEVADGTSVASLQSALLDATGVPPALQRVTDAEGGPLVDGAELPESVRLAIALRGGCDVGVATPCCGFNICCSVA